MSTYAALAHTTWASAYDMTTDLQQLELELGRDPLDDTCFSDVARSRKAGLADVSTKLNGFYDAADDAVDETVFNGMASTLQVVTHTVSGTELDVAYSYQAKQLQYQVFGAVGEMNPFSLMAQGARGNGTLSAGAVRGRLLKAKGSISSTGATGQVFELGAVGATQHLYASAHCFAIGTSFTLQIQSDTASNFPTPTTQMTIGSITAVGGTWGTRVAGAITDTWWRVNVSACSGTSQIAVVVGIK